VTYPPFTPMVDVLKPGTLGNVTLSRFTVSESAANFSKIRAVVTQGREIPVKAGDYMQLLVEGTLMMSDTQMEQLSNRDVVRQARGDVLIAGLGLGLIVLPILAKESVSSVTIVEKYPNVVNLVAPSLMELPGGEKLTIVHADIFNWKPARGRKWDTIYFDIWPLIQENNLKEMNVLHSRFRARKADGGWMDSWQRDTLLARRRVRG
jgi:hypothetical protein